MLLQDCVYLRLSPLIICGLQMTSKDNQVVGETTITAKNMVCCMIDLLRHPSIAPFVQTDTTRPTDHLRRPLRNDNIFSGDIAQWHVDDCRLSSGDPAAVPLLLSLFSDGTQMTRNSSAHPVKFSLMGVPEAVRNAFLSKYHLTYLCKINADPRLRKSVSFKRASGLIFTRSFEFILAPLIALQEKGFFFARSEFERHVFVLTAASGTAI